MKKILVAIFFFCFASQLAFATHNRAGEITYEQITQYFYKATITTYTVTSSPADRSELELFWGDNTSSTLPRTSFQDNYGGPGSDIRKNIYVGYHTYPGPSTYKMYFEDPNRNGGVINIPNSILVPFYVESELIISAFLGFNNSPVLLQAPIDDGVIGQVFIHNPNAFDPDGDSLSYELIFCKGAGGLTIPGYAYPSASNFFSLDAVTGDLVWDSPMGCGEYNVAFLIKEWRNGVQIGFVERDMQITIFCNNPGNNEPPVIDALTDICVTAGDFITFVVTANDPPPDPTPPLPNPVNIVTLTATGAPFSFSSFPATFPQPTSGTGTVSQTFEWQTDCELVKKDPYQFVFKAEDEANVRNFVSLVDLETVRITIVAPAPLNPTTVPVGNSIQLTWDQSICQQAIGYTIYRRAGFYGYVHGPCETGVPAYTGYVKIASVSGLTNTSFLDNNGGPGLAPGTDYCYMIVANFSDGAESYASVEVCAMLKKDLPVVTNVSVTATDISNGTMYVAWSKPTDLDSAQYPPPYEYRILRSTGLTGSNFVVVGTTFSLNDTTFNDSGLNTVDDTYKYKIDLYSTVNGQLENVGSSLPATSVFLSIAPTDEKLLLSWNLNVPWQNNYYTIYKFNGATFDSIGFSNTTSFVDSGLVNGLQYCYYIQSVGNYSGPGYIDPIINNSQQVCEEPYDNVPPCALNGTQASAFNCITRELTLEWNIPDTACADDVDHYNIYYSSTQNGNYSLLTTIISGSTNSYYISNDVSVAGCYYVTAVDTNGNEGAPGNIICVDNCPYYELPNVFTPDGNGFNDFFVPFPYRYIESIDLHFYNRWGLEVFATTDPDINWNGKTDNTGDELPYGTYYYVCKVNEIYISGIKTRELKGYIILLRDGNDTNK